MITSSQNARIRRVAQLNSKGKTRRELGLFTAEGRKLFDESPESWREEVYVSASFAEQNPELAGSVPCEIVDDRVFAGMCDTKTPQGILTVLRIPQYAPEDLLKKDPPLLVILEDLQDPGNVGTILRTAESAGACGMIVSRGCADLYAPKTIRSSMGAVFRMPVVESPDLAETVRQLKSRGIRVFAAHLDGMRNYCEEDYRGGSAFLIGNEGNGLSAALSAEADTLIRIPMEGKTESLNASAAAAILLYTAHRQRHES